MIKRFLLAAAAAAATFMPVAAEVQPGTASLLETIDENGILVTLNHPECATSSYTGQYRWLGFQREMRLCPGDDCRCSNDHEHCASRELSTLFNIACQCCPWYIY